VPARDLHGLVLTAGDVQGAADRDDRGEALGGAVEVDGQSAVVVDARGRAAIAGPVRGDQVGGVGLLLHGIRPRIGELLQGVGRPPAEQGDGGGLSRGQRRGCGACGEAPARGVYLRGGVGQPAFLGTGLRGLAGRVPGVLDALVGARLGGLVGSLLGDGRRILRLLGERRQRSEQQGCRDGCCAEAAGQGARGGHEATSTRAAECSTGWPRPAGTPSAGSAGEAAASSVVEVWPSPPSEFALRVSQPCLFMVTRAKALMGRAMKMTTRTTTGRSRISCGCWRRWEMPRTPRVRTSHSTGAMMPISVSSTRLNTR